MYKKWEDILQFIAVALFIILINIHAGRYFFRLDLTEEKRYTVSEATRNIVGGLDEVVYIEVYLEGELNSGFRRLQKSIQETLEELRVYGGDRIQYRFVNPDAAATDKERQRFYQQLVEKGIQPTNLYDNVDGKKIQRIIFPAALITYRNRETPVLLLKGNRTATPQEQLNQSVEGVEFEFATAIKKLTQKNRKNIAVIEGHDELSAVEMADLNASLSEMYAVDRLNLSQRDLSGYDAVIVAQPKKPYSEVEQFKLDQFIMRGGKAMFFMDMVQMNLDSIAIGGAYAFAYNIQLDELLFRYGVRVNTDLIQDMQMGRILLNVGTLGDRPNLQPVPWPYYPILNQFARHPIVRNLNGVSGRFISTIDTVKAQGITKTPLIFTNQYSRVRKAPMIVSLDELKADLNPQLYKEKFLPVAYLLEGEFTSMFKNRYPPKGADGSQFKTKGVTNRIIVCSDGDLPKSEFDPRTKQPLPLGFDPITKQTFSNKDFIMNSLSYLLDESGIIATRSKEITLRPLDEVRINEEKLFWQVINIDVPVILVVAFGVGRFMWRKKKYERF